MSAQFLILLRLLHVVGGILWGGAAVFYLFFIKPSVQAIGPAGPEFMRSLAQRRKYPAFMMVTSSLTVLAGAVLLWATSAGLNHNWLRSGPGIGFTIGSIAALLSYLVGSIRIGPTSAKLARIGAEIESGGKPPSPEQARRLAALQKQLVSAELFSFVMLSIAMLTMATARYWYF